MKKTFQLHIEGRSRERLLDAARHEIHKYVKRARRRPLPEGVDFWDFECRFGPDADSAQAVHFATLTDRLNAVAQDASAQFHVEILTRPGHRQARPEGAAPRVTSAAAAANFLGDPGA